MKGLGYVVLCYAYVTEVSGSFQIIVQSQKYYPNYILDSIHNFLKEYFKSMMLIKPDRLQSVIETERQNSLMSRETAKERSHNTWIGLLIGKNQSQYNQKKLYALTKITLKVMLDFYQQHILNETSRKMMTIALYGHNKEIQLDVDCNIIYEKIDHTVTDLSQSCS